MWTCLRSDVRRIRLRAPNGDAWTSPAPERKPSRYPVLVPYQLSIQELDTHVHAIVTGDRTPENMLRFLREVHEACERTGRDAALLEMRLAGPSLDSANIAKVVSSRAPAGARLARIAYVEAGGYDIAMARFAEAVAQSQGVNVRLFPDVASAASWLAAR